MTDHAALPVAGYTTQSDARVQIVNRAKELEERALRHLDALIVPVPGGPPGVTPIEGEINAMVQLARRRIQEGFMWANRAVFMPTRVKLTDDTP